MPNITTEKPLIIYTSTYQDISIQVEAENVQQAQKLIEMKIKEIEKSKEKKSVGTETEETTK
jgi:hypothetical protein